MRISNCVIRPVMSEKSVAVASAENKYVFEVNLKATKGQIKNELKKLYDVDVVGVKTAILPGKKRRILGTRRFTKTGRRKKAMVVLKEGQKIELFAKE